MVNPVQCGMPGLPNIHTSYRPPSWRSSWAVFHRVHSWLGEMARSHGFGGPGKAASSNTDEMPSEMTCGSRVVPIPGQDPDAVVDLMGQRPRQPELHGPPEAG